MNMFLRLSRVVPVLAAIAIAPAIPAIAADPAPRHGIAMHGETKYPAGFTHLDYANPEAPKGGEVRHAVVGTYDSLHPWIPKGRIAVGGSHVYESLLARVWDEPFSLYGLIAESVTVPEDRGWVEFTLRPEAKWHDGRPITVDDVLFSYETLRAKGRPNHRSYYGRVAKAEKVGERGVRFTFAPGSDRELPLIMGLMPILAKHYWEGRTFEETTLEPPLGSGPYKLAEFEAGRSLIYRRVENYWGKDLPINRGHNNFDTIRYDYYRDDGVALEAFRAGAYDFRREMVDAAKWAEGYKFPAVNEGKVKLEVLPHGRPMPMRALIYNTRRPIFADPKVREALGHALDFEWMNKTLFHNQYKRTSSYFANSDFAATGMPEGRERELLEPWRKDLPPALFERPFTLPTTDGSGQSGIRQNLRKAVTLLQEAGWTVKSGKLVNGEGKQMSFEILLADPADEKIALEFSRSLGRLGVETRVRTVESAQYQARLGDYDFDMTLNQWISLYPGNEQLTYWGSKAAEQSGTRNYAGVRSPAIDALAAGIAEAKTREDHVARVKALDRALLWGHYAIPLWYFPGDHVAYWSKLRHPEKTPLYGLIFETWWAQP